MSNCFWAGILGTVGWCLQTATIYIENVDTAIYLNHTITRIQSFSIIKLKLFLTV